VTDLPSIDDLAAGAFLHDVGKLLQRAAGSVHTLPDSVRALESTLLPVWQGRYGYKHVLFTEAFFQQLEAEGLGFPVGMRREHARTAAVWHHKPDSGPAWASVVAAADRLSAGMDRKERDAGRESEDEARGWDAFRKQPLRSIFDGVDIGVGKPAGPTWLRPLEATPAALIGGVVDREGLPNDYRATADGFVAAIRELCRTHHDSPALFHEGLIALAERLWWGVPSSTVDEPDVPLLDHSLSVAAFACALWRHHGARGELDDRATIMDPERPKFRLLRGDLSGIQSTLFRLAAQQVKGVNRILRARSFLMGALIDAAALLVRRDLGLPPYVLLMRAGGQFLMLLPELDGLESRMAALQARIDAWMARRYAGDLALVLGLTQPLKGNDFAKARIAAALDSVRMASEAAKQRALASFLRADGAVLAEDYEEGADGACTACGVRPALPAWGRCRACHAEHEIGADLPRLRQTVWLDGPGEGALFAPFDAFRLRIVADTDAAFQAGGNVVSAWRPRGSATSWPVADRWIANHVPRMSAALADDPRLRGLGEEADDVEDGDLLLMEQIAALSREREPVAGRAMLTVLKADVDRLGFVFAQGLGGDRTVGRLVALSRSMDAFFTAWLPDRLRRNFPATYTVYAGGDDLLLIGPWLDTVRLAGIIREDFRRWVGGNPNLTLSAGIELVDVREPLNRSADRAEARLERAKDGGRDRVCAIEDMALAWDDESAGLPWLLAKGEWLHGQIRDGVVSTAWLYKLLHFADEKRKADGGDSQAAIWRARYGYHLARAYPRDQARWQAFNELMGLAGRQVPTRAALSVALWRNR
jgi:CRISPR-associated protein Csm1